MKDRLPATPTAEYNGPSPMLGTLEPRSPLLPARRCIFRWSAAAALGFAATAPGLRAQSPTFPGTATPESPQAMAAALENFERRVRPLFLQRCSECHGPKIQRSGFRVDHRDYLLRGGDRGPAIVPGFPEQSRMYRAVKHTEPNLPMPRKGDRLSTDEVDVLRKWIAAGAPWPDEPVPPEADSETQAKSRAFDLEQRRSAHWCWQAPEAIEPPSIAQSDWPRGAIDQFVLASLRAKNLAPAIPADPATWLRRVTLDLTGLPPTVDALDAFLGDSTPEARERVVDQLLASRAYAEHQARHWLDLVRYAETLGHEFDFEVPNAWRYRDYVIRAFERDVGHDQLIKEHLAGDLLDEPRLDPVTGRSESALGPAYFWFGDQTHSPVDSRKHLADRIDNQIDVTTKAFLGLTVSCARCHDHKFDAISTRDYYSLFGVLESSRYVQRPLDPPAKSAGRRAHLEVLSSQLVDGARAAWPARTEDVAVYIVTAGEVLEQQRSAQKKAKAAAAAAKKRKRKPPTFDAAAVRRSNIATSARRHSLDEARLSRYVAALTDRRVLDDPTHPAHAAARASQDERPRRPPPPGAPGYVFADFARDGYTGWQTHGTAFGEAPAPAGTAIPLDAAEDRLALQVLDGTYAHSATRSRADVGTLHSRSFTVKKRYIHIQAAGQEARINVVLDGFSLIRNPIYGRFKLFLNNPSPRWYTIDAGQWRERSAWIELVDSPVADPADPHRRGGYDRRGWLAVREIVFSDDRQAPRRSDAPALVQGLDPAAATEADEVDALTAAVELEAACERAVGWFDSDPATPAGYNHVRIADWRLLDWLGRHDLLGDAALATQAVGAAPTALRAEFRTIEDTLSPEALVPSITDGTPTDAPVLDRGRHNAPGEIVRRRFLSALGGEAVPPDGGSGRRLWAERIAAPDNPLTARVAVNRIWHHLFGRGLVATVDNFGVLGEQPSHPELLDWLAREFIADGWSHKAMLRRIVLSATYGMASGADANAQRIDPKNLLLHHMPVKRMPAETLRDSLLQIAGHLNRTAFGPGVPVHLTKFMGGRGRPGRSGPLDGEGRRSIYQQVRRNFLNPMLLAFDAPVPFTTFGRRSVSNVPAQALTLLNDPFVTQQAERFAQRIIDEHPQPRARVTAMYRLALGREPTARESDAALAFVLEQSIERAVAADDRSVWQDLAHVVFNLKEFVFIR